MPNVKSAMKSVRSSQKARTRNRAVRSAMRAAIRGVDEAVTQGDAAAIAKATDRAMSAIGKTGRKGVIHRGKASRLQSRLRRRVNRATADRAED